MHLKSIRPVNLGSLLDQGEPCAIARSCAATERIKAPTQEGWGVVGARMWGRDHGITLRAAATGHRREAMGGSSQSVHSSEEAGNDRGAKGRRKVNP
jgi:hypothetical protein